MKTSLTYLPIATLLTVSLIVGCSEKKSDTPTAQKSGTEANSESDHGHPHEGEGSHGHGAGPHDGTLADWGGGKYHV